MSVHWKALKRTTLAALDKSCSDRDDLHEQYDGLKPCERAVRFKVWDDEMSEDSAAYICAEHARNKKGWNFEGVE